MTKAREWIAILLANVFFISAFAHAAPQMRPMQPAAPPAQTQLLPRCYLGCGLIYGAWKWSAMGCGAGSRCETSLAAACPSPDGRPFVIEGTCRVGNYTDYKPTFEPPPSGQTCDQIIKSYEARSGGKMPPNSWIRKIRRKECLREDKVRDFVFPEDAGCRRMVLQSDLKVPDLKDPKYRDSPVCCFNQCPSDSWQFLDPVAPMPPKK